MYVLIKRYENGSNYDWGRDPIAISRSISELVKLAKDRQQLGYTYSQSRKPKRITGLFISTADGSGYEIAEIQEV